MSGDDMKPGPRQGRLEVQSKALGSVNIVDREYGKSPEEIAASDARVAAKIAELSKNPEYHKAIAEAKRYQKARDRRLKRAAEEKRRAKDQAKRERARRAKKQAKEAEQARSPSPRQDDPKDGTDR